MLDGRAAEKANWVSCPRCQRANWRPADTLRGVPLSCCAGCGLLGTTALLDLSRDFHALYDVGPEDYERYRQQYLPHRLVTFDAALKKLERWRQRGTLLEVGSGYGFFLEQATRMGWDAMGVEVSRYACSIAEARGCQVHCATLEDTPLPPAGVDAIVLFDVIEHVPQPDALLARCTGVLRPGGVLLMRTPDARALRPGWGPLRSVYRHFVYPSNLTEHVFHFTPDDLVEIARAAGLSNTEVDLQEAWEERVVSGRHVAVRAVRRLLLRHAYRRGWPYEFTLFATRP